MQKLLLTIPTEPHQPEAYMLTTTDPHHTGIYFYPIIKQSRERLIHALINDEIELPVPEGMLKSQLDQINPASDEIGLTFMEYLLLGDIFAMQAEEPRSHIPPAVPWERMVGLIEKALNSQYYGTRLAALRFSETLANILTVGNLKLQRDFIQKSLLGVERYNPSDFLVNLSQLIEFPLQTNSATELDITVISKTKAILLATQLMYFPTEIQVNTEHVTNYIEYINGLNGMNQQQAQIYLFIQLTNFNRIERSQIDRAVAHTFGELLRAISDNNELIEQLKLGYIYPEAFENALSTFISLSNYLLQN